MRRASLFLCIVVLFAAVLFLVWPITRHAGHKPGDAEESGKQAGETTALRGNPSQPGLSEATAILRMEISSNVEAADLVTALGALLERPQLDEISARLALETAWSTDADQTARRLAQIIKVGPRSDGGGGVVRASDVTAVMAVTLANTAASVLQDHFERAAKDTARQDAKIRDQQDRVEDQRKLLASIIRSGMMIQQADNESRRDAPKELTPAAQIAVRRDGDAVYFDAKGEFERSTQELSRMESQRREVKEITIHHILWAEAKARE